MSDTVVRGSADALNAGSQSFAAAARLFDAATREDATLLYAWCRHCDDVIDGQMLGHDNPATPSETATKRLKSLESETGAALDTDAAVSVSFEALRRVVRRNGIDHSHPYDLLQGFRMDVEGKHYRANDDLLLYCYHVAGVVGVMMARVMSVRDAQALDRACDLGIAFQLTNIARDLIDDARAGRCYVPDELMASEGLRSIDPDDVDQRPAVFRIAVALLEQADAYYESAFAGLPYLPPRSAWAIAAARRVYRAIGTEIRRRGPGAWDGRAGTSRLAKLALVTVALGDVAITRVWKPKRTREGLFNRPTTEYPVTQLVSV